MNSQLHDTMARLHAEGRTTCGQTGFLQLSAWEALDLGLDFDAWRDQAAKFREQAPATFQKQFRLAEKDRNACLELEGKTGTKWGKSLEAAPQPVKRVQVVAQAEAPKAPAVAPIVPGKVCRIAEIDGKWLVMWDPTPGPKPTGILRTRTGPSFKALLRQAKTEGFTHVFVGNGGQPCVPISEA